MQDSCQIEAESLFYEGSHHISTGSFDAAAECFLKAIALASDFAQAHANLGFVLDQQGDIAGAEICYRKALVHIPECSEVHLNLGVLLAGQKRFEEAQAAYARAIDCDPDSSAAWSNLGVLLIGLKREEEAEACLRLALEINTSNAKALFNLSYLLLRQARFEEGWFCLEARDWYRSLASHFTFPRWDGESLAGQSLLMIYEAGHGDVIQFCRYAQVLKAQGAGHITLICHPALKRLLHISNVADAIMAFDENIPTTGWDYWMPLMSAPYHCRTRAETIPAAIPYLQAEPNLVKLWADRLPPDRLRVGLVWRGNPKFENDADRSLPSLNVLAPLWAVTGVSFFSLQKGTAEQEAQQTDWPLLHLGAEIADFADAAAIVMTLDLVICVDTAMAHLAGALGKPCWVLLPYYMPDWRWLSEGAESPWYPGCLRLFRQRQAGDWRSVVEEVAKALPGFVTAL